MRKYHPAITGFVLILFCMNAQAQTPNSAKRFFQHGQKSFAEGNLEGAFEDYSRAIEISSRLDSRKTAPTDLFRPANSADNVTVIDPFTANAYTNRGVVRYQQHYLDEAMADFNAAIRISPRLAEAYVGRGVIYRVKGDLDNARTDFDRAISINPRMFEESF